MGRQKLYSFQYVLHVVSVKFIYLAIIVSQTYLLQKC